MPIKEITNRRSIRKYKPDPVSDSDLIEIIKAAQFAPSGRHIHPIEFIIIKNQESKNKLFDIFKQEFIKQAPVIIVPIADTKKSNFCLEELSISSAHIFLQATTLGLGTVWKHVGEDEKEEVKKLLNIPAHYTLINTIPLGFAKETLSPHTDAEFESSRIHEEKF